DPTSLFQPEGVHGNAEALDLTSFGWTDEKWKNPALKDYIIYELHIGTFTPAGTFESVVEKLDHLVELGVTAVEIMPVAQFPRERNWGYDGVFPFAVQNSYGGPHGLQTLVDACHAKGLAVVLDVVYNHVGPEGNYLGDFAPYFTDKYKTPWGSAINFDDAWCDGVRRFAVENALMWFRDFHIDALRLDAVHAIKDFSPKHILQQIKEHVNALVKATGREHYVIVENDLNDVKFIDPIDQRGYGMDAQWTDEFHHALRVTTGQQKTGYYKDFDGIQHLAKSYRDVYVYDGQYSPHRYRKFGTKTEANPGQQFIVFSQNHDQVGNRMLGERTSELVSFEMQKLMAGAVLTSPFLPLLFMGEEYGEPNPFQYFVSHTDLDLVEAVRKGRKAEFKEFHAQGEAPDPQSKETFERSKLQWETRDREPHRTMFAYYKHLVALRKKHNVLNKLNRWNLKATADEKTQVLTLCRWQDDEHLVCFLNFSKSNQSAPLPQRNARWHKLLDSASPDWNGPAAAADTLDANATADIQPESLLIYSAR
ncbi:MAG TPA: malto-oligosyltrehalose trehalohydrolase, partial [Chitinophagales bacterium]|nr:malto-oligosyltrehalose trehalohydrolase [Chitinophagales bacterium]